jgi:hypothetical protein
MINERPEHEIQYGLAPDFLFYFIHKKAAEILYVICKNLTNY